MSDGIDGTSVPKLPRGVRFRETSLDGIVADHCTVFAASDEVIRPDVEAFFLDLRDKQMLTL